MPWKDMDMTVHQLERRIINGLDTAITTAGTGTSTSAGSPVIFVHGNPDSADEWAPFLDRADELGRVIAPDMPGFGRSGRPARIDMQTLMNWFAALVDDLGLHRYRLVVHDWGSVALAAAAIRPERLDKLVVIDGVALSAQYRWHWLARVWRTPILGELAVFGIRRPTLQLLTRLSSPRPGPMDEAFIDEVMQHLDAGMRRAILGLYRSADPAALEAAGAALPNVRCPSLVVWGEGDPYLGVAEAHRFGEALADADVEIVPGVGHWCFREDPAVVDRVIDFLGLG
jgi:pimeloyl-ACP methyl ester carboxylesterase